MVIFLFVPIILIILLSNNRLIPLAEKYKIQFLYWILFIIMGCRVGFGRDYEMYNYIYNLPSSVIEHYGFEPVWIYIYELLNNIGLRARAFFIVTSGFTIFCVYKAIKMFGVNPWIATFVFILSGIYFETSNTVRQCVAQVLIFLSFPIFKRGKTLEGIILCIGAVAFHYSAAIAIIMLSLSKLRLNRLILIIIVIICCFIGPYIIDLSLNQLIPALSSINKYQYDVSDFSDGVSTGLLKYVYISLVIGIIIYKHKMIEINPIYSNGLINLFVISICTYCVFYSFQPARRLFAYGFMFIIPIFPIFLKTQSKSSARAIALAYAFIFLLFQIKLSSGTEYDFDLSVL